MYQPTKPVAYQYQSSVEKVVSAPDAEASTKDGMKKPTVNPWIFGATRTHDIVEKKSSEDDMIDENKNF